MPASTKTHTITSRSVLNGVQRLLGISEVFTALEDSPHKAFAGMTLASSIAGKLLADHKITLYQKITREMARAGIDIASLSMMRISGPDTIEYSYVDADSTEEVDD